MINSVILLGRLVENPTLKNYEGEFSVATVTLAVTRAFKNSEGEYDTDFIRCVLWDGIAKNTCEYCKKGDMIALRGRLTSKTNEVTFSKEQPELKKKIQTVEVVAERVVFVNSNRKGEQLTEEQYEQLKD